MKKVHVKDAIGMVLVHDLTKIVPGEFKGRAFKKGHVIRQEDIDEMLKIGKEHVYVMEQSDGKIHENDAAVKLAKAIAGNNIEFDEPYEGKSMLKASIRGLLKVNSSLLYDINSIKDISIASLPNNFTVEAGQKIAGARVVPLFVEDEMLKKVEELTYKGGSVFNVKPYASLKVGVVTTGNEVYKGLIEDKFGPLILEKLNYYNATYMGQVFCPDDADEIMKLILSFVDKKADVVIVTGGMSVDPDDTTPSAIRMTGANVVTHGIPVQPGNMFMMAYLGSTVILGVPAGVLFFKTSILDVVLPRVFVGETLTKKDFVKMGEGGLCLACEVCRYPNCYFCRG